MKVLHLLQSSRFSGAENVVCQIIRMMAPKDNINSVYCSQDGQIKEALDERRIKFASMSALTVSEVNRVLCQEQPDIVHAHDIKASCVAALACGRRKLICHIHGNCFGSGKISLKSIALLIPALKANHIIYVCDSAYRGYFFHKLFKKKSSVLSNSLDAKSLNDKVSLDTAVYDYEVVFIGRLSKSKNPERLLRILRMVIDRKPNLKAAIIGSGELEDMVFTKWEELSLQRNVSLLGFQSNPFKMLRDSKVMIMASLWEGTPMCALEAMALGVPIVGTPTDGLKDLVKDGISGYLSDSDEELADRIIGILTNAKLYESLHDASLREFYKVSDINGYHDKITNLYKRLGGF